MKHLSRLDIEAIARQYIKAYLELPEVKGSHIYRIDPELFVEKVLGLTIQYEHLSYDGKTLGLTSFEEVAVSVLTEADEEEFVLLDGRTVLIESDLMTDKKWRGRKNFTIMHEGCHQIFKALFPNDYGGAREKIGVVHYYKVNEERSRRIKDWEEWQANTLTSAIFLPPDLIKQGMFLFDLGEKIDCLNKVFRPAVYEKFSAMADFLGSSKKALAIRMKQLGMLKEEYLDNPMLMADVF